MTILKFKRHRCTYTLPFTFPNKSSITVDHLVTQLIDAINNSGGLLLEDKDDASYDNEINEDDIEVPKSELIDDDGDVKLEEGSDDNKKSVTKNEVSIAIPKDKSSPYDNQWIPIDDANLKDLIFNDYDILAFKYVNDGDFEVIEAAYEDQ